MSTFMCIGGQEKFETLNLVEQESWRETKSIYIFTTLKKKNNNVEFILEMKKYLILAD